MFNLAKFRVYIALSLILYVFTSSAQCQPSKLIDLDFKNADVKDVLRVLAVQEGANFLIDNEVAGTVTIHLTKITFEDALNIIAQTSNLQYIKENNVFKITQIDKAILNVDYTDSLLSVEAKDAKLTMLIQVITQKTGLNLVSAPELKDRITISLNKIPLQNALDSILIQANCIAEKNGAVTFIRKKTSTQQPFIITFQNNLLSIDAQNVPIASLTRAITEKTGISVVPNQDLSMNISIYFQSLPLPEALNILCNSNNLQLINDGQSWRIARAASVNSMGGQNMNVTYDGKNGLFDLEIQSSSISTVISEMARKADLNIVILAQVNWTVNNVRLRKLKFEQALDFLLKGTIFTYKFVNNTYLIADGLMVRPENADFATVKVYPIKYLKADQLLNTLPQTFPRQSFMLYAEKNSLIVTAPDAVQKLFANYLQQIDIDDNEDHTLVIPIKYLKAEDILKYFPSSIPKTDIIVVKETNSITVTGPQNLLNQVKQYIDKVDQVNPLIVFDVMVVNIQDSNDFNWSSPSGSYLLSDGKNQITIGPNDPTISYGPQSTTTTTALDSSGNVVTVTTPITPTLSLTALIAKGKAKVISNPTITTLNGYPTSFSVSTKRTYTVHSTTTDATTGKLIETPTSKTLDSGLTITITPWVANDQITMEIKPKISEYGSIPQGAELPETTEHATETTVRVKNKQTIIISGLKNTRKMNSIAKVPILGDIPLLGYLFQKKTTNDVQEEFVIIITPHLVYDETDQAEALKKINDNMSPDLKDALNPDVDTPNSKKKKK
jgi:type II secretory pathway component GspD/PulD (secretin)